MATLKVYSASGELVGEMEVSSEVFGILPHREAMHACVVAYLANQRQGTHSTKTRGEVSGGGRKPWRQKHTGRARHGSIRSPIWVGGGVAHGPKPRSYWQKVNKKVRALAIRSALSAKLAEGKIRAVEGFPMDKPSTKGMIEFLNKVGARSKPLVIVHERMDEVYKSVSNIPDAKAMNVASINVYDLLKHDEIVMTVGAVRALEEVYA